MKAVIFPFFRAIFLSWLMIHLWFCELATAQVGATVEQLIVTRAASWTSNKAQLQCYQRSSANEPWHPVFSKSIPVMLGRAGLAWGRGAFQPPLGSSVPVKVEKDQKAPAGIFQLGKLFGYASTPPRGCVWPYHQVGPFDAYVDDPENPYYNQHIQVRPTAIPPWFEKQRMRLGDNAYQWMLEICHNQRPAMPGYGSAIFFHVRRGPDKPSAGCTTMALEDLEPLLRWINPSTNPHYVLLPEAEYQSLRAAWKLP
jgi:L,D-peptidoglycan transpeptidase YkuD (ErfK/YbiS/YcfS/YnhG family)